MRLLRGHAMTAHRTKVAHRIEASWLVLVSRP